MHSTSSVCKGCLVFNGMMSLEMLNKLQFALHLSMFVHVTCIYEMTDVNQIVFESLQETPTTPTPVDYHAPPGYEVSPMV